MQYYKILSFTLTIFTFLLVLSMMFLLYTIFKGYRYTDALSKKIYDLGKGVTSKKVEDFIVFIDTRYIPFRFYTHGLIKAGFRIVDMDKDIDIELKKKLKIMALSKGILVE